MAGYQLSNFPDLRDYSSLIKDLTGQRFGRLTVVAFGGVRPKRNAADAVWICRCCCSTWRAVRGSGLKEKNRITSSCGCYGAQRRLEGAIRHGQSKSSLHRRWRGVIQRCTNANARAFKYYGGRGIAICDRWRRFENFYADMGNPPFPGAELERIDNNGNYEPSNVRWSTRQDQMRNMRRNVMLDLNGERKSLSDWARVRGWHRNTIDNRLHSGWSVERALTEPPQAQRRR